jgi:hypothetical protein
MLELWMAAQSPTVTGRDDRVRPLTRGVALAIIPFLGVAFAVLYPWPHDTGRLFAWGIKPTITSMILGSIYLGGAYFFLRVIVAKQWHTVKGGFVPVGTFATLMGVATVVHWDRFIQSHVAFWLWAGLYFTTPFLIAWAWWANRRHDVPDTGADLLLPVGAAWVIAVVGVLAVLTGVFLFLFPNRAVAVWPWALTPLTARVLGAIFFLGTAGLGALVDRRWSSARILFQVAALMLTLILLAGIRANREFDRSSALTWLFAGGFVGLLAAIATLYLRMRARDSRLTTQG